MKLDIGMVCKEGGRYNNEDIGAIFMPTMLFLVVDGMGGHANGDIAAEMVRDGFQTLMHEEEKCVELLRETASQTNNAIVECNRTDAIAYGHTLEDIHKFRGMGAVATAIWLDIDSEVYHFHHVGDSRGYECVNGELTQFTCDHSLEHVRALPERQRQKHPYRNVVSSCYGSFEGFREVHEGTRTIVGDMTIMICSDGLTDYVNPDVLNSIMLNDMGAQEKANALYQAALDADTKDNVTVLVIRILDESPDSEVGSNSKTLCPTD